MDEFRLDEGPARILRSGEVTLCPVSVGRLTPVVEPAGHHLQTESAYCRVGKRGLDIFLILATLPLTLTLVGVFALALWLEGGAPFYRQDRLGQNGRRFSILKLRTMVRDADQQLAVLLTEDPALKAEWEQTQKLKDDPRITPVGRVLRSTSLDELPQLWNVLKGEMSLVGPRPMMPDQLGLYGDASAYFSLRPGLTGLWQVSARNDSAFAFRSVADREYAAGLSFLRDISLLLRTVWVMIRRTGY